MDGRSLQVNAAAASKQSTTATNGGIVLLVQNDYPLPEIGDAAQPPLPA